MKYTRFYKYPPLQTFEDFKKDIAENDPFRMEYFYKQILWGEKIRHKKIARDYKKMIERKRATQSSPIVVTET